jgi:hypothetical protein
MRNMDKINLPAQDQANISVKHQWPWQKIIWTKKLKIITSISSIAVLALIGGGIAAYLHFQTPAKVATKPTPTPSSTPTPLPTPTPKDHPNPLNGVLYTATDAANFADKRPIAVMVENHVDARPQSGLQDADILYEAMAEGGITRFMAVYLTGAPTTIGPVRSARKHFVEWAAEYDSAYAHWGGSAEALNLLRSISRPKNLDEFIFGSAFYRNTASGKSLEHTGYTSMDRLRQVAKSQSWESAVIFHIWPFKDDAEPATRPQSQTISLGFLGTRGYDAKFTYRSDTNDYVRFTGGTPHMDALSNQQLTAKTIILQYQQVQNYTDSNGHPAVHVTTIGNGKATILEDGTATEGTWAKPDMINRTTFTDANGKEIPLNRGKIWIISVPTGSAVSY